MNTNTDTTQAVVIGGSMAGLLIARVLSEKFDRVTIIERDNLPENADYRNGVPQARHLHALLARGQRIIENLFPGFQAEIQATGAPQVRIGVDSHFVGTAGAARPYDTGVSVNAFGRTSLEWLVRRHVKMIANVGFMTETDVEGLLTDDSGTKVTGVQTKSRRSRTAEVETLRADLVIDASGRRSKAPEWLIAAGYTAPETTIINAHTGYATRWYKFEAGQAPEKVLVAIQTRPAEGLYRGGGYMLVENGQMVVTLIGANGDYPPTDEAGFLEFSQSLSAPDIYEVLQNAIPVSPIYAYRGLENQMRHYERLVHRPENFIIMGDAAIAFNPIYGQGMSSAAMQAELLQTMLEGKNVRDLTGLAATFQKRLPGLLKGAWMMSTGEDMRYPDVEGAKPGLIDRIFHKYTDWTILALSYDGVVGTAFVEAQNLLKAPTVLMRPDVFARVIWHNLRHALRRPASTHPAPAPVHLPASR